MLEKLLKQTEFKKDATDIARQLAKVGIDRLELLADAPGRLRSAQIWGHPLSGVIAAIREAAANPTEEPKSKPEKIPPVGVIEPAKPAGGKE